MKVRIVCYEDPDLWILGKFAKNLKINLQKLGHDAEIVNVPDPLADINHHIIFNDYNGKKNLVDTLMITHIDNIDKLNKLKKDLSVASLGICMSFDTMCWLSNLGISNSKLCYVNPAHDFRVNIKKIVIGLFCRVQSDGRKREYFLDKLCRSIHPAYFKFVIMGDSWEAQISNLKFNNFEVDYFPSFIPEKYEELILTLDYYLYMGMDEGQMGVLDAHAAGVKTIVTAQGYHLDLGMVTYPFVSFEDLLKIFLFLQAEKQNLVNSVNNLTWMNYTLKHVEIWNFLIGGEVKKSEYKDGYNSIFSLNSSNTNFNSFNSFINYFTLVFNKYFHKIYFFKNKIKKIYK
jgi:hypothetical protein